jgi:hypothetical protein
VRPLGASGLIGGVTPTPRPLLPTPLPSLLAAANNGFSPIVPRPLPRPPVNIDVLNVNVEEEKIIKPIIGGPR